ncbi:MAG TPA: Mut7-C RNAse domain-containing protein [Elusimicrobiota bacterium]|nr:Mut7-C RNAse domain-containing protein [Elusimicrobiota bacterium]
MSDGPRFLADAMLGRLARWLRLLGYDTAYDPGAADEELLHRALREGRVLLTGDGGISRRKSLRLLLLRQKTLEDQLRRVMAEFRLRPKEELFFSRCPVCNEPLAPAPKEKLRERVPERVFERQDDFYRCAACEKIYWQGSHSRKVREFVKRLENEGGGEGR